MKDGSPLIKCRDLSFLSFWTLTPRNQHSDVVSIQQNLIQFCHSSSLWGAFKFCDIFQHHIDIVIKTQQHSHNFFVILHNDVNARSNTFIHQLCFRYKYQKTYKILCLFKVGGL